MDMIPRQLALTINEHLDYFPIVAVVGPRQCGKTTLVKSIVKAGESKALYLDLEKPSHLAKLQEPEMFLTGNRGKLICLDEIQRSPELFPVLRSLCDESGLAGQFIVLGSASPDLLRQSSESLAGRISYIELTPILASEWVGKPLQDLWFRGGFPRSLLAPSDKISEAWRQSFIATFLERDLPQLGIRVPALTMRRFLQMCAHLHGSLWNASKIGGSLGVTNKTVNHYLSILEQTYLLRRLMPLEANLKKRLVKSPKVFFRDSGLLHSLLGIGSRADWFGHPAFGSSWEGLVIENLIAKAGEWEPFFFRTAAGAEVDLVLKRGSRLIAVEIKASTAPKIPIGFRNAIEDLAPEKSMVVAPVDDSYPVGGGIEVHNMESAIHTIRKCCLENTN
jgi:predicted AAA+ superfamily ATPase